MDRLLFEFEVDTFEKADSGEKSHRIGGYASTSTEDREGESLVQKGLDFSEFLSHGWFNDNHEKGTSGVIGYPTKVEFHKGHGWYVEGYLLKGMKKADEIWEIAKALKKSKSSRKLGFSVEGKIVERKNQKIIKAVIRNIAVTHVPINPECTLEVLSKAMCNSLGSDECMKCTEGCYNQLIRKAITTGYGDSPDTQTGGGALRQESNDKQLKCPKENICKCREGKKKKKNGLTQEKIEEEVMKRGYSPESVKRIVNILQNPKSLEIILQEV